MVDSDSASQAANNVDTTRSSHVCELHPLLTLVSIPGAGMGFVASAMIKKGTVLLTESSICSGPLSGDSADDDMVTQFLNQLPLHNNENGPYQGNLLISALTVSSDSKEEPLSRAFVQQVLDNNVYQCRREPRSQALFVALARFNHSCDPNAVNDSSTKLAKVRAVRDLETGDEVTISYVPLSDDLATRTEALSSFGFTCHCERCIRERIRDPSTQCMYDCGSTNVDVDERHEAVVAANDALQDGRGDFDSLRSAAETALLVAPYATHPETIQLHRNLVRLLDTTKRPVTVTHDDIIVEQLREVQRLDQAHCGADHRDLHFLRCFARLVRRCDRGKSKSDSSDNVLKRHVQARWKDLCLLHFGVRTAPGSFTADIHDNVQYVPIGCNGERLLLLNGDDEINLSGHEIGDTGCGVLCTALIQEVSPPLTVLDLDSNGLSSVGGIALANALVSGAAPLLGHLDLMCNNIRSAGACALASALRYCPLLKYLDMHGNAIGDDGCAALGAALSADGASGARLVHLNLSANDIEDCSALSSLFAGGRMLAHLDLSENAIENCSFLFCSSDEVDVEERRDEIVASSLTYLDLSWNCIADFEPLTRTRCFTALVVLRLEGNVSSDQECNQFYATLKASGVTPMLEYDEDKCSSAAAFACEEDGNDELGLQQCLLSLADGETINPRVCANDIWENNSGAAAAIISTAANTSVEDSDGSKINSSHLQGLLQRDGYFVVPQLFPQWGGADNGYSMDTLASTMDRLELAGWPPVFCFMSNAVWDLISTRLWDEMRTLLGDDCVLEPSFFAWSLKPPTPSVPDSTADDGRPPSNSDGQIGQSFGLPHRDYSATESMFEDGKTPKLLNVWIPVNDATLENGCMNILPREFDANFCRPEDHAHMRSATSVRGTRVCKLRFPLNGARAVPARAGSLLAWCGNTIHWGSSCSRYSASPPRRSIAMTFRRRDVAQLEGVGAPITQECARDMSLNMRLALISQSLLLYNQWHTLNGNAVPPAMYHVTSV